MTSPFTQRRYPLTISCEVYRLPRSTLYVGGNGNARRIPSA